MWKRIFWKDLILYQIVMLVGIAITSALQGSSTMFWVVYLFGFFGILYPYLFKGTKRSWLFLFFYVFISFVTMLVNSRYFAFDVKTIGLTSGVLIVPLYVMMFDGLRIDPKMGNVEIEKMMSTISVIGTAIVIYIWAVSAKDIIGTLSSSLGAYKADLCGFFNSKNSYGAYVALSLCPDVYLYKHKCKKSFWVISGVIKLIAVFLSYSRAALLQVAITVAVFFVLEVGRSWKEWMLGFAGCTIALSFVAKNKNIQDYLFKQVIRVDNGDAGRGSAREYALSKFESVKDYVFGLGYGGLNYFDIDIDNSWYYIFITGGALKIIVYSIIILFAVAQIFKIRKYNLELSNICFSVTASYIIYAMFESVPILELGLLNFMFMIYMFFIPYGYSTDEKMSLRYVEKVR